MASLLVTQGPDEGQRFIIDKTIFTIGRDSTNDVRLHDPEASRRHAEIQSHKSELVLVDVESSNGVFVNGLQVKRQNLNNGDHIQIGKTVLLFIVQATSTVPQSPLVDIFLESEHDPQSKVLHSFTPEESCLLFNSSTVPQTEWLKKARSHLKFICKAATVASRTLDVEHLLNRILELIFQWAPIDRGCIFLYDKDLKKLVPKASRSRKEGSCVKVSQTILNYVLKYEKGVLTSDAKSDLRWDGALSVLQNGVKDAICVPMIGRYDLVGIIYIDVTRHIVPLTQNNAQNQQEMSYKSNQNNVVEDLSSFLIGSISENVHRNTLLSDKLLKTDNDDRHNGIESNLFSKNSYDSSQRDRGNILTPDHLKLMLAIGYQAGLAVEDTQYYLSLAQAERLAAIGQTVAVLSHHIKNILQGIRGGSFLIHTGLNEHEEELVVKGWNIVEKNQTKISDLVLDMLTFSKERVPVWSYSDFNEVISDVVELMSSRAKDLDVDLLLFNDSRAPQFYFDKEQIHRAIVNLIGNALEASKDYVPTKKMLSQFGKSPVVLTRGRVETKVHYISDLQLIRVIVDDVGSGVPIDMRETIFRPFNTKNKSGGTGLGLAVTHKILQEHKGTIKIEDSPLGGARFIVELPLILEKPSEKMI